MISHKSSVFPMLLLSASIVISLLWVLFYSSWKEIDINALIAGWGLGTWHLVFFFVLFIFSRKRKKEIAFNINFFALVFRFGFSILILTAIAVIMNDNSFIIVKDFYISFLLVYFFYVPFEIYALKKLSN